MKNQIKITIVLIGLLSFMASCDDELVRPSGNVVTSERDFSGFNEIEASSTFEVNVTFSDQSEGITIHADDNLAAFVEVKRQGDRLFLALTDNLNIKGNAVIRADIVTSSVHTFVASGASKIRLMNELNIPSLSVELSGASGFDGVVNADGLSMNLSGASNALVTGATKTLTIQSSGASEAGSLDLFTERLDVELSGASTAFADVSEEIHVIATGASDLNYSGNATIVNQNISGASTIKKRR